ncbi:MAG: ArsR/SmtB family transcription factor [Methanomassiliicoccales archaeon]
MSKLDDLLSIVENPTRRRILQELVREPHYPLQLSRELRISQQAVMKHLKVLEENNLVKCYAEDSDLGGPRRKLYVPTTQFSLVIDVGPGMFNAQLVNLNPRALEESDSEDHGELSADLTNRLEELRGMVREVDQELASLQKRRGQLLSLKERALGEAKRLVEGKVDDYQLRRILYEYVHNPGFSAKEIAKELSLRDEVVRETLNRVMRGE